MTRVLLITDTERVQRIFQALEEKGVLQLRIAGTLTQGDQEILSAAPDITFIQSRISGFSGDIMLGHLRKTLPKDARIVLLAGDADDAAQARRHAEPFLDLADGDQLLTDTIMDLINGSGHALPKKGAAGQRAGKKPSAASAAEEAVKPQVPEAAGPSDGRSMQESTETAQAEEPVREEEAAPPQSGAPCAASFQEIMELASAKTSPSVLGPDDVQDRVDIGTPPTELAAAKERLSLPTPDQVATPLADEEFFRGEPLADAMLRAEQKKRPRWVLLVALLLVLVPLTAYLSGRKAAPNSPAAPAKSSPPLMLAVAVPGGAGGPAPVAGSATAKAPATPPAGRPQVQTVQPSAKPASGLKLLPGFLEGTRFDAAYGKAHPGWVRYVGKRAEYNLFREADLYKAMQVIAPGGGTVSDQLFKRVLADFGGGESYRMESTGYKGDYVLEQGAAKNGVAVSIYRKKKDSRIKAVVLYYR